MEHKEKNTFLLAAAVSGFVYWAFPFFSAIFSKTESPGIQVIQVGFFEGLANFIKNIRLMRQNGYCLVCLSSLQS